MITLNFKSQTAKRKRPEPQDNRDMTTEALEAIRKALEEK